MNKVTHFWQTCIIDNKVYISPNDIKNLFEGYPIIHNRPIRLPAISRIDGKSTTFKQIDFIFHYENSHPVLFYWHSEDKNVDSEYGLKSNAVGCFEIDTHENAIIFAKRLFDINQNNSKRKLLNNNNGEYIFSKEMKAILDRLNKFWTARSFYKKYNLPYRRGILLYGLPGTGKTTFAAHVCKTLKDISVFRGIYSSLDCTPGKKLVVLDEIESDIERPSDRAYFLSEIEGVPENTVIIATTNCPDKIDPAFFNRPGRFDDVLCVGLPSEKCRLSFLKKRKLSELLPHTAKLSYANMNELIYRVKLNKEDPKQAYEELLKNIKAEKKGLAEAMESERSYHDDESKLGFG